MAEFTVHPQYLRKLTLKSLHKMENMSKPLVEFTFSFSWWILISNLMLDVLICINENVSLHKSIQETNYVTNLWFCSNLQCTNCCFASADVTAPFMKCDERQWSNDVTVNIHCDVTMGRWRCLANHISQQWVGDVITRTSEWVITLWRSFELFLRRDISWVRRTHLCMT